MIIFVPYTPSPNQSQFFRSKNFEFSYVYRYTYLYIRVTKCSIISATSAPYLSAYIIIPYGFIGITNFGVVQANRDNNNNKYYMAIQIMILFFLLTLKDGGVIMQMLNGSEFCHGRKICWVIEARSAI